MNDQLLQLQSNVTTIIYNPFVNLKDQIKALKTTISKQAEFSSEFEKLDAAIEELDVLEDLPHGNIERIKGFNKIKNRVLKLIKEVVTKAETRSVA